MMTKELEEEKSLRALLLALSEGLSVYGGLNKNFVPIKVSFSQCAYLTAITAIKELVAYIADQDRDICRKPLCLDLDEMGSEDYWMEKLATMRPSELNQLKAAVTMPSIDERAAYAHFHEHRKHIASFCGTGNNAQFLSDPTGNRRWLPFEVDGILSPRENPFDYEGIYSQAYALYRQGFEFKRTSHSRGYIVIQRDGAQIKERLKQLALDGESF